MSVEIIDTATPELNRIAALVRRPRVFLAAAEKRGLHHAGEELWAVSLTHQPHAQGLGRNVRDEGVYRLSGILPSDGREVKLRASIHIRA